MAGSPVPGPDGIAARPAAGWSAHGLLVEVATVVSHGRARHLLTRARRVAGLERHDSTQALETLELLMLLEALAAEGGELQMLAETLARRALYADALPGGPDVRGS